MTNVWLKMRIWTKVVILAFAAMYLVGFLILNRGQTVDVWVFFGTTLKGQPLLEVIGITLAIGIIGTLLAGLVRGTVRQIREVRERGRSEQLQKDVLDMKTKAAKLQTKPEEPKPPVP